MEFYDAINSRRTIRDFKDIPIPKDVIHRILNAGLKAPSNDHMRNWEFIIIDDKKVIADIIKKIPKKVSDKRIDFIMQSWKLKDECQQNMYKDAIPKQYQMLINSGCVILPFYKQAGNLLEPKNLSSLNGFASIWCCIENIFLAAAAEGLACAFRIPLGDEEQHVAEIVQAPKGYFMPCYISLGYPDDNAIINEQIEHRVEDKIHYNGW